MINSYSAQTLDALATIAAELGQTDDAAQLSARATKMRAAMLARMVDSTTDLFLDGVFTNASRIHSAISSQYFPVGFGVLDQASPAQQARTGSAIMKMVANKTLDQDGEPACSCMGGHWLLEALYTMARSKTPELSQGADGGITAQAASAALAFLTHNGTWLGMIAAGATATMEVWTTRDKPNLSWSHPWCSAPANIVPRRLMGIQPLSSGFTHFEVYPQPGALAWATLSLPTVQGKIELNFNQTIAAFDAVLSIPPGTTARVCLPTPTASSAKEHGPMREQGAAAAKSGTLTVDGATVGGVVEGRMLCAPTNLTAGTHKITRHSETLLSPTTVASKTDDQDAHALSNPSDPTEWPCRVGSLSIESVLAPVAGVAPTLLPADGGALPLRASWVLSSSVRGDEQLAYELVVGGVSSGKLAWSNFSATGGVPLPSALKLAPDTQYELAVRSYLKSQPEPTPWANTSFSTGLFAETDWRGAAWIGAGKGGPDDDTLSTPSGGDNLWFRKAFTLSASPTEARLHVAHAGFYKCKIGGSPGATTATAVGDYELGATTSWWTRMYYDSYDVSHLLPGTGEYVLSCLVGKGRYGESANSIARPTHNPFASRSVLRALLISQANPGSLYRRGKSA